MSATDETAGAQAAKRGGLSDYERSLLDDFRLRQFAIGESMRVSFAGADSGMIVERHLELAEKIYAFIRPQSRQQ